jgi:hypothetical protein
MRFYVTSDQPFDVSAWVSKSDLVAFFDQEDFACRAVRDVCQAYPSDWFYVAAGGLLQFRPRS